MKEEFNKDMEKKGQTETLEKNSLNQIKNTGENHSSRLKQVENRISVLEDKIDIKENMEEILDRILKRCKRNTQELNNSINRQNL
jgi:hypothetical protein